MRLAQYKVKKGIPNKNKSPAKINGSQLGAAIFKATSIRVSIPPKNPAPQRVKNNVTGTTKPKTARGL